MVITSARLGTMLPHASYRENDHYDTLTEETERWRDSVYAIPLARAHRRRARDQKNLRSDARISSSTSQVVSIYLYTYFMKEKA